MKRLINPMEMVRAVVRGEVGNTSFIVYAVIFVLSALLGVYMTYTDLVTDSSEMFAFSGGDTAYATLSLVSIAVYFLAPAMLAWKKMSFREYIKYFICLDIPLTVVAFFGNNYFCIYKYHLTYSRCPTYAFRRYPSTNVIRHFFYHGCCSDGIILDDAILHEKGD